uniref:Arp2/3 complex 34 kDa subunit n=1 Tax=Ascaris lumbricoides TaxID=6252 RepID=A0A0M3HXC1_ASCLU
MKFTQLFDQIYGDTSLTIPDSGSRFAVQPKKIEDEHDVFVTEADHSRLHYVNVTSDCQNNTLMCMQVKSFSGECRALMGLVCLLGEHSSSLSFTWVFFYQVRISLNCFHIRPSAQCVRCSGARFITSYTCSGSNDPL